MVFSLKKCNLYVLITNFNLFIPFFFLLNLYFSDNAPAFFVYLKFLSVFNYGYDLLMINQWEKVEKLKCEFQIVELCKFDGLAILDDFKLRTVSYEYVIISNVIYTLLNILFFLREINLSI